MAYNLFTQELLVCPDQPAGGNIIGPAGYTTAEKVVDLYPGVYVVQTTAGQDLTLFSPTGKAKGWNRPFAVTNGGTASFTMYGTLVPPGKTRIFYWYSTGTPAAPAGQWSPTTPTDLAPNVNTLSVANLAVSGAIATANQLAAYTSFSVAQTTAGVEVTVPALEGGYAGTRRTVTNTGTASFVCCARTVRAGETHDIQFNGSTWVCVGAPTQTNRNPIVNGVTAFIPATITTASRIFVTDLGPTIPGAGNLTIRYTVRDGDIVVGTFSGGGGYKVTAVNAAGTLQALDQSPTISSLVIG